MPAAPDFPPAPDRVTPKRALISLSDKTGLVEAAQALHAAGIDILSTGGTKAAIAKAGIPVTDVSDVTGFPEMMDGRVKTLHPKVHGALLAYRDAPEHARRFVSTTSPRSISCGSISTRSKRPWNRAAPSKPPLRISTSAARP